MNTFTLQFRHCIRIILYTDEKVNFPGVTFLCSLPYGVRAAPVGTFKIPNTGSHTIVCTHENAAHTVGMGSGALAAAEPYPVKATRVPAREK